MKNNKEKGENDKKAKASLALQIASKKKSSSVLSSRYYYTIWTYRWFILSGIALAMAVNLGIHEKLLFQNKKAHTGVANKYSHMELNTNDPPPPPKPRESSEKDTNCKNREDDKMCKSMAKDGACEESPGWMFVMCPKACNACRFRHAEYRCKPENMGMNPPVPAFVPGQLDNFFEDLPKRFPEYNIEFKATKKPWIAIFHNFISDREIDALIRQTKRGMRRSTDQGQVDENGVQEQVVSSGRTSTNAWCDNECEEDPDIYGVSMKIEAVTGIPYAYYESFQVLRYDVGQFYREHHDMGAEDNNFISGPRILTFLLYLSDVEEGGGTHFPKVNNTIVLPKKGDAVLWNSVLNEDLTKQEPLTNHAALPVIKGVKYAANHWIHLYDYKTPNLYGCTGAFD